jgi:hypothetical protein
VNNKKSVLLLHMKVALTMGEGVGEPVEPYVEVGGGVPPVEVEAVHLVASWAAFLPAAFVANLRQLVTASTVDLSYWALFDYCSVIVKLSGWVGVGRGRCPRRRAFYPG